MTDFTILPIDQLYTIYEHGKQCGSGSLQEIAEQIADRYYKIPEDDRRFCVHDQNMKDHGVLRILKEHNLEQ